MFINIDLPNGHYAPTEEIILYDTNIMFPSAVPPTDPFLVERWNFAYEKMIGEAVTSERIKPFSTTSEVYRELEVVVKKTNDWNSPFRKFVNQVLSDCNRVGYVFRVPDSAYRNEQDLNRFCDLSVPDFSLVAACYANGYLVVTDDRGILRRHREAIKKDGFSPIRVMSSKDFVEARSSEFKSFSSQ